MNQKQKENLASVINAAIERYPLEDIAEVFIDQISGWKDKRKIAQGLQTDNGFTEEFLSQIDTDKLDNECVARIIEIAEYHGTFIKTTSLVQAIRVDEFLQDLKDNPYQLKLIA